MPEDKGGRPYTVYDLEGMPDDGHRYELIDGALLVSPAPGLRHQRMGLLLALALEQVCPQGLVVVQAPFAVRVSESIELQPDVLVARESDLTDRLLPVAPVLAVEVLSPSSVIADLNYKKAVYERIGVPAYWVLDPQEPKLSVFEFGEDGLYELVAEVKGDDPFDAERPFPVRIVPGELLGSLR
ncbi:Uma2 family endonuclease [Saccharothrix tamanrassetensis]|uniref:Uma2 family endonuclease n=2 Tax=Saccharothrix tamanrassetensis TaxID=1051531 RepID=A0A841CNX0_9PSEU|nr:Uma2 family endonuclease [Saccharothrix tamanrassetensis]